MLQCFSKGMLTPLLTSILQMYIIPTLQDLMYKDPRRNAMAFQSYVQLTMLQMHQTRCDSDIKVMERSIHSAR